MVMLGMLSILFGSCSRAPEIKAFSTALWPAIESYDTGYLKVSEIHELYYEQSGNPNGKPVFVLHGGPGGSVNPLMRRFFNPEKYHIIMYDQRGAGKSRPFADVRENTTWTLVDDIEKLRIKLGIDSMMLFGGSWGSTLALAYAETYPQRVTGMILRGVWTSTQAEIDHFYHGGAARYYPEVYDQLIATLPEAHTDSLPSYIFKVLTESDAATRKKVADAWLRYEWLISDLKADPLEVDDWISHHDNSAFSIIENYYMANHCFLEENQLIDNANKIKGKPAIIINGHYDMCCPPITAYRLHQALPGSKLVIVPMEGHYGPEIEKELVKAAKEMEQL
jgi:proline iminopeptidase